jgi:hypothetical protein
MNSTFQTTTIGDFLDNFAGRRDMVGYDDTKSIKIAECNRDFVWPENMQKDFIRSILQGFPIPAMCITNEQIVDGGNRSTTLWLYRNNQFAIAMAPGGPEMNYDTICKDRALTRRWDSAVIPQQVITNATPDQFAQIYENLNKGIVLTFGQLLENRKYRPWVAMAEAMIRKGTAYPDGDLLRLVWPAAASFRKNKQRNELGFGFQILVGAERGPAHFHSQFANHIPLIMGDVVPTTDRLRKILELIEGCDEDKSVPAQKKTDVFKKFIGAIIYDMHTMENAEWVSKWTEFIPKAYNTMTKEQFKCIANVGNKRASINARIAGVSENVQRFLEGDYEEIGTEPNMSSDDESDM